MHKKTEAVRCRDVYGRLRDLELSDRGDFASPGSALEQHLAETASGALLIRKVVTQAAGRRDARCYDLLDHEVRAGTRLGQVFGDRYPPELARLVGYNLDVEEPFLLMHFYRGEPAAGQVAQFDEAQRRQFQIGLLQALHLAAAAGVVHGAVGLTSLRWDGSRVQLVDFEAAADTLEC